MNDYIKTINNDLILDMTKYGKKVLVGNLLYAKYQITYIMKISKNAK